MLPDSPKLDHFIWTTSSLLCHSSDVLRGGCHTHSHRRVYSHNPIATYMELTNALATKDSCQWYVLIRCTVSVFSPVQLSGVQILVWLTSM